MQYNELYDRTTGKKGEKIPTAAEIESVVGISRRACQSRIREYWAGKRSAARLLEPCRSNHRPSPNPQNDKSKGKGKGNNLGNAEWQALGSTPPPSTRGMESIRPNPLGTPQHPRPQVPRPPRAHHQQDHA